MRDDVRQHLEHQAEKKLSKTALLLLTLLPCGLAGRSLFFQVVLDVHFSVFMLIFLAMMTAFPFTLAAAIATNGVSGVFTWRSLAYAVPGIMDTAAFCLYYGGLREIGAATALVLLKTNMLSSLLLEPHFTGKVPRPWQVISILTIMVLVLGFVASQAEITATGWSGPVDVVVSAFLWGLQVQIYEYLVDRFEREGANRQAEISNLSVHSTLWCAISVLLAAVVLDQDLAAEENGLLHGFDNPMLLLVSMASGLVNIQTKVTASYCGAIPYLVAESMAPGLAYVGEVLMGSRAFSLVTFTIIISLLGTIINYTAMSLEVDNSDSSQERREIELMSVSMPGSSDLAEARP